MEIISDHPSGNKERAVTEYQRNDNGTFIMFLFLSEWTLVALLMCLCDS